MKLKALLSKGVLFASLISTVSAGPLYFESFESYNLGALDQDLGGGPNSNPTNPWAGPFPDNCHVVNAEMSPNGIMVTPFSGTKMVRGSGRAADFDQDYFNLVYWLNASNNYAPFTGNFYVDWRFFDCVGQGTNSATPDQYDDFLALCYYSSIPPNQSYNPNLPTSGAGFPPVRISIGGTGNTTPVYDGTSDQSGYDSRKYQTRDESQTGYTGPGWLNLPVFRSVGWHHARIEVLPQRADTTCDIALYVDNMSNPAMRFSFQNTNGFNSLELNGDFGSTTISAYWDDIMVDLLPSPTLSSSISGTNAVVSWNHSWILQSTSNLASDQWADVVDQNSVPVNSPYTNGIIHNSAVFFRLRN